MSGVGNWWDSVELWVAGLAFVPQVLVVMAVLVPLAAVAARILDVVLARVLRLVGRGEAGSDAAVETGSDAAANNVEVEN